LTEKSRVEQKTIIESDLAKKSVLPIDQLEMNLPACSANSNGFA